MSRHILSDPFLSAVRYTYFLFFALVIVFIPSYARAQSGIATQSVHQSVSTPISAGLEIDAVPLVGNAATIICSVKSLLAAPGTTVEIVLPSDGVLVGDTLFWQGDLIVGQVLELTATVIFEKEGNKTILCRALSIIDSENSWGDLAALYLSIGETRSLQRFSPTPFDLREELAEPDVPGNGTVIEHSPSPDDDSPSDDGSPNVDIIPTPPAIDPIDSATEIDPDAFNAALGNLTITGHFRFYDRNDNLTSTSLLVQIVRGDNDGHLAFCYTDSFDGSYSCGPFENPGAAGVKSTFMPYVKWFPYSEILITVNPDLGTTPDIANTYRSVTTVQVFSDGVQDIGSWNVINGGNVERSFWITDDLSTLFQDVWFETGAVQIPPETSGPATVEWKFDSTDGTYYLPGENIHLAGVDPLSDTVVNHEYGHAIMYNIYGGVFPIHNCPSPHFIQQKSNVICAWTEGWATFMALAAKDEPIFRFASGATLNLETPTWGTPGWDEGDDVEGRVTGALWDIVDTVSDGDDQYAGIFDDVWDTFYHQNDDNFLEYWTAWKSRGHNQAGAVLSIFQNTIDYRLGILLSGSCPGPGTLSVFGATPNGRVAIAWSPTQGQFTLLSDPCIGTTLELAIPTLLTVRTADVFGDASLSQNMPAGACGVFLQALDLVSCLPSNLITVP